jgi:hypothetical protein
MRCTVRAIDLSDQRLLSTSRATGLRSPSAVLGVLPLTVAGALLGLKQGSGLAFRMISFNSLVALVISCSSAATAWRLHSAQHPRYADHRR